MAIKTTKNGLFILDEGTRAWHEPLNSNFKKIDDFMSESAAADLIEIQETLAKKADASDINAKLDKKADKTAVETALNLKANSADVANSLALKADKTALTLKADKTNLDDLSNVVGLKADKTALANLAAETSQGFDDINEKITGIGTKEDFAALETALALKADKTVVAQLAEGKADKTEVTQLLGAKADKTEVEEAIEGISSDISEVANAVAGKLDTSLFEISQQLFWCQDEQPSTTPGGTFTAGAWRTRAINTLKENSIARAYLNSNQITLPKGDYWIEASAPAFGTNQHRARLYDITRSITLLVGTMEYSWSSAGTSPSRSFVIGKISLERTTVLELQHFALATSINTNGLGMVGTAAFGDVNVFAQFIARRLS